MGRGNKDHWYDGRFYEVMLAPHQDRAFTHVREFIEAGSAVLDVGCGTGRLAFQLAGRCDRVDAVDPSGRNIAVAMQIWRRKPDERIRFHHDYAESFLEGSGLRFDYATASLVVHEIAEGERVPLLKAMSASARHLILVDYLVPRPAGPRKLLDEAVEFLAGPDHYRNFKSFVAGGGLPGLLAAAGLRVEREVKNDPPSIHVVKAGR